MHWIYAHLIGDYILQNDWMALSKKKSWFHAAAHGLMYSMPFFLTGLMLWQIILIGIQHVLQDHSHIIKKMLIWKGSRSMTETPMAPWGIIVVDNIVHILFIAFVVWLGTLL